MSSTTSNTFATKFGPFAQNAWSRFPASARKLTGRDQQEAIENWARTEARTFFHIATRQYPFVRIYSALARFANVQLALQQQREATATETKRAQGGSTTHAMKEQNKAMADETIRVVKPAAFYEQKLEKFARVAWTRYNPSQTDIANWARTEARTFYHLCDGAYAFVSAWQKLVEYGENREADGEDERRQQRQQVAAEAARDFRDAQLVTTFAEDGEQTAAERRAGRAELNRILFREHTAWWDAFEAEAAEDMEEDAPDAAERFSQHCARIISRRTGLRADVIAPVVGAWLHEKSLV
jgi:hypothetical protein